MKKKAKIRIGIVGISGRMGKSIAMAISKSSDVILAAGCEHNKHKDIGKDIGERKRTNADEIDLSKAGSLIKELLNK